MIRSVKRRVEKWWAALALLSIELAVILAVFFAALFAFGWLVRRVFILEKTSFDQRAFEMLEAWIGPITSDFMVAITFLGTHFFLIPANLILIVWYLFVRKHRWYSIKVPTIAITSLVLMLLLKEIFGRDRPLPPLLFTAKGFSFPSGHAFMSTTFYGLLAYIVWRDVRHQLLRWSLILVLTALILTIGLSRIYLRVHYASDVLAGLSLGIVWLVISISVIRRMELWSKRSIDPMIEESPSVVEGQV
jgi:membrane-associated phospholipid phosphatase